MHVHRRSLAPPPGGQALCATRRFVFVWTTPAGIAAKPHGPADSQGDGEQEYSAQNTCGHGQMIKRGDSHVRPVDAQSAKKFLAER